MQITAEQKAIAEWVARQSGHDRVDVTPGVPVPDVDGAHSVEFMCRGWTGATSKDYAGKALIRPFFGTPVVLSCTLRVMESRPL